MPRTHRPAVVAVAELRVAHGPLIAAVVDDPPVAGVPCSSSPDRRVHGRRAYRRRARTVPMRWNLGRLRRAAWRHHRHEAHVLELGELGPEVVDGPASARRREVRPRAPRGCSPSACARRAAVPAAGRPVAVRAALGCCQPAGRGRRGWYQRVCSAAGDLASRSCSLSSMKLPGPPRGRDPSPASATTSVMMRPDLEDVVLADEARPGPSQGRLGQRPGFSGPGGWLRR